jgi:hypothetical protein
MRRVFLLTALALLPVAAACSSDGDSSDAGADARPQDAAKETSSPPQDSGVDVLAPEDSGADASADAAAADAGSDAGADASVDAGADAAKDAAADAGSDAGADASVDAASDAAVDASDAGGSTHHTITCDGTIGSQEWGGAEHLFTTGGGQKWSMAWDATNLYVALASANVAEGVVLYVGHGGGGITVGQNYDNTAPATLPFSANAVVYAKNSYREVRTVSGNGWGAPVTNFGSFCAMGNDREIVIPWAALGANAIPASFRWLGYATSAGGFVYGQVPETNPSGNIGTGQAFPDNYFVGSTSNGGGAFPFAVVE